MYSTVPAVNITVLETSKLLRGYINCSQHKEELVNIDTIKMLADATVVMILQYMCIKSTCFTP